MTGRYVYDSEELTQALGGAPDNLTRLGVLAALDVLGEGDLSAVFFFATRFSGRQANLPEVAEGLLWLRGHRYLQASPCVHRDVFWERPREIKRYRLSPDGRALYARLVPSTYRDNPPRASSFDRLLQRLWCSEYTFWGVVIGDLILFALALAAIHAHR